MTRSGLIYRDFHSHLEFEGTCKYCHQPLQTTQDQLCVQCHTNINDQITLVEGTHGAIRDVQACATCHSDHKGVNYDLVESAFQYFDHTLTDFDLVWHQVDYDASPMVCSACHVRTGRFSLARDACTTCHALEQPEFVLTHVKDYSEDCLACHDGQDRMVAFDHQNTDFPLLGKHKQLDCAGCHSFVMRMGKGRGGVVSPGSLFENMPSDCVACHAEPDEHSGLFNQQCDQCHTPEGWRSARLKDQLFDHQLQTNFSLDLHRQDYDGGRIGCLDCHTDLNQPFSNTMCVDCHSLEEEQGMFIKQHQADYGQACIDCHDGIDRMMAFDHNRIFILQGRHAQLACQECHIDQRYTSTPSTCVECHAEPEIHAGFFGLKCQYCHQASGWAPAGLNLHSFPLTHGVETSSQCQVCHLARYEEYTCYTCHDHTPELIKDSHQRAGIPSEEIPNCIGCHPAGVVVEQ